MDQRSSKGRTLVNLIFIHASGMRKSVWEYHVINLFNYEFDWNINRIILVDQARQGDSGVLNADLLRVQQDW